MGITKQAGRQAATDVTHSMGMGYIEVQLAQVALRRRCESLRLLGGRLLGTEPLGIRLRARQEALSVNPDRVD